MSVERINPAELARPSGFSHAVAVTGGRTVFLAGQVGMDRDGKLVGGGVVAQFEQALANLLTALAAAGGPPGRPGRADPQNPRPAGRPTPTPHNGTDPRPRGRRPGP